MDEKNKKLHSPMQNMIYGNRKGNYKRVERLCEGCKTFISTMNEMERSLKQKENKLEETINKN